MQLLRYVYYVLPFLCFVAGFSQTKASGIVVDSNGIALPFADVYFKDSKVGTTSKEDGTFYLSAPETFKILVVSYSGFQKVEITLSSKETNGLRVELQEGELLEEIEVVSRPTKRLKKKENPAYPILKKIWDNKSQNGIKVSKSYEYTKYSSLELGISNIDSVFLRKVLRVNYDSIISVLKSQNKKDKLYIPLNLNEKIEKYYGNNILKKERVENIAKRQTGVGQNSFIYERVNYFITNFDIYKDDNIVLDKTFTSPISRIGFGTYDYVLKDSVKVGNKTEYKIFFFPRRNQDYAFEGYFIATTPQYAVTKVSMRVNKEVNLNMVRNLFIEKSFNVENDSVYLESENLYEGDFTLVTKGEKEKGIYVKKKESYTDYVINKPKADAFYFEKTPPQKTSKDYVKGDTFWKNQTIGNEENAPTQIILKDLEKNRKLNRVSNSVDFITSGFINVSRHLQFGQYWNTLSYNNIEKMRVRAGFRTFKSLDDRFRSYFYYAYGFGDKVSKYGVDFKYLLFRYPRITLLSSYSMDYEQLGSRLFNVDEGTYSQGFGSNVLISRGRNFYLSNVQKISFGIKYNVNDNLLFGLGYSNRSISSALRNVFSIDYINRHKRLSSHVSDVNINAYMVYTPKRNVVGYGVEQQMGKNLHPSLTLKYTYGLTVLGSSVDYQKAQLLFSYPFRLSIVGVFQPTIEMGKTFGSVPLVLLDPIPSNQGYSLVPRAFSLLNYYDFVTDTYAMGHFEHHFNGFIMNRIPLISKLKLKSILTFRAAYGAISKENRDINRSSIVFNNFEGKLYYEYGFGFENIGFGNFKFFRVDFIWRSDLPRNFHTNRLSLSTSNFGIRFGIIPGF